MNKGLAVLIFIILVLGGLMFYYYQEYEKPQHDEIESFSNISISAKEGDDSIITGYEVYVNSRKVSEGKTYDKGFVLEEVNMNESVSVINYNLENQHYYTDKRDFESNKNNHRVELDLEKPAELNITQKEPIYPHRDNFDIEVEALENKPYKNPHFCLSWTSGFWHIKSKNYTEVNIPDRLDDYDKCYDMGIEELDKEKINLKYSVFSELYDEKVKISFFDGEEIMGDMKTGENIGAKDTSKELNVKY